MKNKFLGAVVVGALALSVACSKNDKKSTSTKVETKSIQTSDNGEWVIDKVEGDDNKGAFVDGRAITIVEEDGKRFLLQGSLKLPFEDGYFTMEDGRRIKISAYENKDKVGESLELQLLDPSSCGSECKDEIVASTMKLSRPKKEEVKAEEVKSDDDSEDFGD